MGKRRTPLCAALVLAAFFLVAWPAGAGTGRATGPGRAPDIERILAAMPVEEKVGQLFMVFFTGPEVSDFCREALAERHVGGFILYKHTGNTQTPEQTARLCAGLNALAGSGKNRIGPLVSIDQEGGPVARLTTGVTWFPSQMAVAAAPGGLRLARAMAAAQARELAVLGINVNFTPVADVNVNPDNPVIGVRSFGSNPAAVAALTREAVRGYAGSGVLCCLKHFPGHGDTDVDSHVGLPVSNHDLATLNAVDFPPFRAGMAAGAPMVMTAHVETPALDATPGLPATLSAKVLTGTLRRGMHFDGLIVTDSLGMGAVARTFGSARAALMAFEAGADVLLFGADKGFSPDAYKEAQDLILAAARSGALSRARLDASVRRILAAKARLGLLGDAAVAAPGGAETAARLAGPEHAALAREIAGQSLTLVTGRAKDLPFDGQKTAIVWPQKPVPEIEAAVREMAARYGCGLIVTEPEPDAAAVSLAAAEAAGYERLVVLSRDAWRYPGQAALIARLAGDKPGAVLVAATGSPYDARVATGASWFVAAYCDVPQTIAALGRALFAGAGFPGRLPVRLARPPGA
jgi:beta-N-acetylhexosaminidase